MLAIVRPHGFTHPHRMAEYFLANVVCMPLASTVEVSGMILAGVSKGSPNYGCSWCMVAVITTGSSWGATQPD